ncbi:unnamed protein product [Medioppia subpectinata]|uniref:Uncharacterized protein n=1 Tax=Medioppia subpectinata TaxID=1979941 RepID=A0A7R9KNT8_9ACAR|nr:unnamed protein product [Medioppia subpectinata]CAG2106987.1 unnamed protein product [Medioppia subpectinata]
MIRFVSLAAAVAQYRTNQNVYPVIMYHSSMSIDSNGYNNNCKDNWMLYISTIVIFIILMILSVVPLNSRLGIFLGVLIIIFLIIPIYTHWKRLHDLKEMSQRQSTTANSARRQSSSSSPNGSADSPVDHTIHRHPNTTVTGVGELQPPPGAPGSGGGSIYSMNSINDLPPKYELPPSYSQTIYTIDV